jgi:arylsulfatase A-like enzyme
MTGFRYCLIACVLIPLAASAAAVTDHGVPDDPAAQPNILFVLVDDMGFGDLGANGNSDAVTPNMDRLAAQGVRFSRHYTENTCQPTRVGILTGRYPARAGFRARGRGIPAEWVTLPEALRAAGYRTRHIGKWHIGIEPAAVRPLGQGFDHWYGFLEARALRGPGPDGEPVYRAPTYHNPWLIEDEQPPRRVSGHLNDILTERAVQAILTAPKQAPWFINLWYFAPHRPIQPAKRYPADPNDPVARFRALMRQLDDNVGRLLGALDEAGLRDRTLVVLASDNGGSEKDLPNNAPFRGAKQTYYEGGIRTPLLMRWPGRHPAGRVVTQAVSMLDLYPTLAASAGAEMPADLDGRSLVPALEGRPLPDRPLFWELYARGRYHYSVLSADGRWRLWRVWDGSVRLFDLASDPHGTRDVHPRHPATVAELDERYRTWHDTQRRIPVTAHAAGPDGKAVLTGRSLARTPGLGGYTFGIGVRPKAVPGPSDPSRTLVDQAGIWRLSLGPDGIRATFPGIELRGGPLSAGLCNGVVVTGLFDRSLLKGAVDQQATVALYVNGELRDTASGPVPAIDSGLDAPTRIGLGAAGEADFQGRLGRPLVLNTHLGARSKPGLPGVEGIAAELCADLPVSG